MFSGFAGGFGSGPLCCFLELIMIQQQRFGGTILGTPSKLLAPEGPMAFTRGLVGASLREGIYTAGFLGVSPFLLDTFSKGGIPGANFLAPLVSAVVSGSLS